MPAIQFGLSSYERGRGDMPELPVVNMWAEEAPTEEKGVILQSRPELQDMAADMGTGPVQALFKRDLVLSGSLFGVSGGDLYRGTASLGATDGSGPVSIAGNEIGIMVAAGGDLSYYNGSVLATVSFPDGAAVAHVFTGGSRFWAIRLDTGKIYWTDALEADVEALDFATAESLPDRLLHGLWINGMAVLFGAESVELWAQTGNADLPITPLQNAVIERGIRATGCAAAIGSTFAWVTNRNEVCLSDENNVISNTGLQARIEASGTCRLFTFDFEGDEFLALRLDEETQVWSRRSGLWSELTSYGEDNWIPQCFAGGVFGSAIDGRTLEWGSGHEDMGGTLERRWRAGFPINGGGTLIGNVQVRCNVGQTPFLAGDYTEPGIEMRVSRNAGRTWSDWRRTSLGGQGDYRTRVQWRGCGMASQPAFLAEFRVTDPVDFRVSDVLVNEPYGGR